jgi:hypothetical protein
MLWIAMSLTSFIFPLISFCYHAEIKFYSESGKVIRNGLDSKQTMRHSCGFKKSGEIKSGEIMMKTQIKRRTFLKTSSLISSSLLFVPAGVLGKENQIAANDRINVGCIGVGPQGTGVMRGFLRNPNCQVVALCDVKRNVL